ncbi:hypothetical protein [Parafrankia sp. EUN1f]|uniref:hypothetical protein n=1 Tax=Parafrankia sp. EUN1f TaxID=102897 RepID=UPI0001C4433F|nr:hypothetical protein [Parafrankia sp. EUN1f]EFC83809.1 hypothetical protein FrEUN1fDRAFT_3071 [Parafrankia sp. EUN1f]
MALSALQQIVAHPPAARVGVARAGTGGERLLPVLPALARVLPAGGLRRGTTVSVSGSSSLLLTLLAEPSQAGAWCGVVGHRSLGMLAALEAGVVPERLAVVADPGPRWPVVVAALLDAMDIVVLRPPRGGNGADARRLVARARERGALLLVAGDWEAADLRLSVVARRWSGLGQGHGHLRSHSTLVRVEGRGAASRPRQVWLAGPGHLVGPALPGMPAELAETVAVLPMAAGSG